MRRLTTDELRAVSRALADPRRFEILQNIAEGTCVACSDLLVSFPVTPATMSHHLSELEAAGLIQATRRGKFMDLTFRRDRWDAYLAELNKI